MTDLEYNEVLSYLRSARESKPNSASVTHALEHIQETSFNGRNVADIDVEVVPS